MHCTFTLSSLDTLLDLANCREVFIELHAVVAADFPRQGLRIFQDKIEDALPVTLAPSETFIALTLGVVAK